MDTATKLLGGIVETTTTAVAPDDAASTMVIPAAAIDAQLLLAAQKNSSWFGFVAWSIFSLLQLVSTLLYHFIRLCTMTIPTLIFTLFSSSWTVTMNATTLLLIITAFFFLVSWVVRYRYLNMYSRLPPEPQRKEPQIDLFPDSPEGAKSGFTSYLDEFLSAIKIFGYLERPVFHELTRSMQTRKLIAGESFNLEDEKGFCIVVDGQMEVFVKSNRESHNRIPTGLEDEEVTFPGQQKYQLLTEVRNGASMSSLFSIMSLFTEDVGLRLDDDESSPSPAVSLTQRSFTNTSSFDLGNPVSLPGTPELDERPQEVAVAAAAAAAAAAAIPPMSLNKPAPPPPTRPHLMNRLASSSAHPDVLARAVVDTTIAIIPASAFRRLIKVYPKATAHIVHVILTRFQRVTLAQAYDYLGLTPEVLQAEKNMIQYTVYQLPNILRGDSLSRLKEKFQQERERCGSDNEAKGIALHNASVGRPRSTSGHLRREAVLQAMTKHVPVSLVAESSTLSRDRETRNNPSPGDLIGDSRIPPSRLNRLPSGFSPGPKPVKPLGAPRQGRIRLSPHDTADEDNLFRIAILECMFKAIGLATSVGPIKETELVDGSPRLMSFEQRRQKALFGQNAFGFMGPYEGSGDGDTESMTSGGFALPSPPNPQVLATDMRDDVEIVFFPKGSVLIEQGERSPGLFYLVDGFLDIGVSTDKTSSDILQPDIVEPGQTPNVRARDDDRPARTKNRQSVALIKPGGLAGYVSTISSYRSFVDVVAKTDVYVGLLPRASLERIVDRYPIVLLTMAKRLTSILPRLILHIDFALEWTQVNAGQVIFHDKDDSDAIYIVLNGRLRLVEDKADGRMAVRAEYGQGESVGELEVLTESVRSGTLHAIRDTELVKFPRSLFNSLAQDHPSITIKIAKIIASRMRSYADNPSKMLGKDASPTDSGLKGSSAVNLRTVAILPVTLGVPVVEFGNKLMNALSVVGSPNGATCLSYSAILNHLGKHAFNRIGKLKLSQYLADLEEKYGLVVYVADTNVNSPWTQTCITQADCILLVGLADGSPEIGEYERFMLGMKSTARKTLVLVHADRYSRPGLARSWLKNRMWINGGHHHVQMSFLSNQMTGSSRRSGTTLKERVQLLQAELFKYTSRKSHGTFYSPDTPVKGDFHRLARRLCGRSVGLVLGGGGARGISQIGIIRAMEEEGIPIDLVGGTSIGSFIGALYARHADVVPIYGLAKKFAGRMASMWRFALDVTYPSASYTTGHEFNRGIFKTFGDSQIEDFWLEYYCNTTNISKSRQEIHTSGYAWRYIRASMSLAGLLPPLCDEGSMLLDGGYIDNLTVSHMKRLGADMIFAVDVGSIDDDTPQTYGDTLSGAWAFFNRWNPLSTHPNPPTLADIQARLAYVSSVDALERAKTMAGCMYMRPPIDDYGTLDFGKFDEIYQVGYAYGKEFLQQLRAQGVLFPAVGERGAKQGLRRTMGPRRASI